VPSFSISYIPYQKGESDRKHVVVSASSFAEACLKLPAYEAALLTTVKNRKKEATLAAYRERIQK
jgi:hypothetical protein